MNEEKTGYEGWAIVELFGRQMIAGRLTTEVVGGGSFVRVDVPATDGAPGFTKFFGPGAIYAITPTDEATAAVAGVGVDEILWCDCATGRAWQMQYVAGLEDVTQRGLSERFERAGIPDHFMSLGFDTIPEEHRAGKELAIAAGRMFAERGHVVPAEVRAYDPGQCHVDRRKKPGLCFVGNPGVGKTGILSVAFRARLGKKAGLWIELYEFFNAVQSQYGKEGGDADARLEAAKTAPLLFLDDVGDPDRLLRDRDGTVLGIAAETDDRRRLLWEILDYRHGQELPTLMTSNLTRSNFERQWGTRLAARAWEMCWVVPVTGCDLRVVG